MICMVNYANCFFCFLVKKPGDTICSKIHLMMKQTTNPYFIGTSYFFAAVLSVFFLLASCSSSKIAGTYTPDKAMMYESMFYEELVLRKNRTFIYQFKWDMGAINADGAWMKINDRLILMTPLSQQLCFSVTEEMCDSIGSDSLLIKFLYDQGEATPFPVVEIRTPDSVAYYEGNERGEVYLPAIDCFSMTARSILQPSPFEYASNGKRLKVLTIKYFKECYSKRFFQVEFQVKNDTLMPVKYDEGWKFKPMYKQ